MAGQSAAPPRELQRARLPALTVLRMLPPLIGMRALIALGVLIVVGGVVPNVLTLSLGWLVTRIQEPGGALDGLVAPLALAGASFVVSSVHGPALNVLGHFYGGRFDTALREEAMRAASGPAGIAHLEDPRTTDRLVAVEELVHGWITSRSVLGLATAWTGRLRGLIAGGILATFAWWAPVLVYVGYRTWRVYTLGTGVLYMRRHVLNTQPQRRAAYVGRLMHGGEAAKETRIFGLSGWFIGRFREWWDEGMEAIWRDRLRHEVRLVPFAAVLACSVGFVAYQVGVRSIGTVGAAAVVVYLQAIFGMSGFANTGDPEWQMHFGAFRVREARRLAESVRTSDSDLHGDVDPAPLADSIRLDGVRFSYPGQDRVVLESIDFEIPAGTSLAIVGENGAGKTTLIKLLCRLYDPGGGAITVDGVDLRSIDPHAWRKQLGVIFQDFVKYELSARENIGFGAEERMEDQEALRRAADLAGATAFLDRIGWSTPLSRKYEGGTDLSGGEWQRIALARALFAVQSGARLLILDEPTANLDVRAEAAIYERFLEITKGVTTIIISHRFSTVRMADRIVVIDAGRVIENGTHEELIALGGRYAEMFTAQASAYGEDTEAVDA